MPTLRRSWLLAGLLIILAAGAVIYLWISGALPGSTHSLRPFDGQRAYALVEQQMALGPRPTGSEANYETGELILETLEAAGWRTSVQQFSYRGTQGRNLSGKAGSGPVVLLGAHYDTRRRADRDPAAPGQPVPGANDGASGVAVLLELARVLDTRRPEKTIWLVFFDAEDNGGLDGWDWIAGSRAFASTLSEVPEAVVIVDMIGDADQQIYLDRNSDPALSAHLWSIASGLGYGRAFVPAPRYAMLDDHTPFAELGIPAVDIIDFDYPYWHTTEDTLDKVSPTSLERVGRTLQAWLEGLQPSLDRRRPAADPSDD